MTKILPHVYLNCDIKIRSNDNILICIQCWKCNFYYHAYFYSSIVPRFTKSSNLFIPTETTISHVTLFLSQNNSGKLYWMYHVNVNFDWRLVTIFLWCETYIRSIILGYTNVSQAKNNSTANKHYYRTIRCQLKFIKLSYIYGI